MENTEFKKLWLAFVNIKPRNGLLLGDLIDSEQNVVTNVYAGAWANILVKASTINEAVDILPFGLNELGYNIEFIDKVENVFSLMEYKELKKEVEEEAEWLLKSNFHFKISDRLFPYE